MSFPNPAGAAFDFPKRMCRSPRFRPGLVRTKLDWPEVSEIDVIRHYTRVSQKNHAIDIDMYPLGSCTMKYNPKINEVVARLPGFAAIHPYQPASSVQGALELMFELQEEARRDFRISRGCAATGGRRPW